MDNLEQIVIDELKQAIEEEIDDLKKEEYLKKIEEIKNKLQVINTKKQNYTKWRKIITTKYTLQKPVENEQEFIQTILDAYHLVLQILENLKLIRKTNFSLTFISDNYEYYRLDGEISAENLYLDRSAESHGSTLSIRIRDTKFKQEIENKKQDLFYQKLSEHFRQFADPFIEYENNNNTNWKINKGVLAETFERHYEKFNHPDQGNWNNDIESVGRRWLMYRQSSGSDPFFTGPDTVFSQVKTTNAALISNVDTVYTSLLGVEKILKDSINIKDKNIKKIFSQSQMNNKINSAIWDAAGEEGRAEIIKVFQEAGFKTIIIKRGKQTVEKIKLTN